jgi:hypothetical protein
MLEGKKDLDLTLMHVKETVKKHPDLTADAAKWIQRMRDLTMLEQQAGEQYTVVQVYRTALENDCKSLSTVRSKFPTCRFLFF